MQQDPDRLARLEERIAALEAAPKTDPDIVAQLAVLRQRCEAMFDLIRSHKNWAEAESDLLADTRREMIKLAEAYYHLFPDRLAADVPLASDGRVEGQEAGPAKLPQ